MNIGDN